MNIATTRILQKIITVLKENPKIQSRQLHLILKPSRNYGQILDGLAFLRHLGIIKINRNESGTFYYINEDYLNKLKGDKK